LVLAWNTGNGVGCSSYAIVENMNTHRIVGI